jgi:hypothetical protein
MSRRIELEHDALLIRYGGVHTALTLVRELRLPYVSITSVGVGADDIPSPLALRRVGFADPITGTRRGRFWAAGKKWFLDLRNPARAVVIRVVPGSDYDVLAIETDLPQQLADAIRARVDPLRPPP